MINVFYTVVVGCVPNASTEYSGGFPIHPSNFYFYRRAAFESRHPDINEIPSPPSFFNVIPLERSCRVRS